MARRKLELSLTCVVPPKSCTDRHRTASGRWRNDAQSFLVLPVPALPLPAPRPRRFNHAENWPRNQRPKLMWEQLGWGRCQAPLTWSDSHVAAPVPLSSHSAAHKADGSHELGSLRSLLLRPGGCCGADHSCHTRSSPAPTAGCPAFPLRCTPHRPSAAKLWHVVCSSVSAGRFFGARFRVIQGGIPA